MSGDNTIEGAMGGRRNGAMGGRAGKAMRRDARRIARAGGRGEARPRWLPGAGGRYDGAIQTCAGRAGCVRQASIAAEQEERRVARQRCACRRSGRACAGCGRVRNARRHARAFPALNGSSPRRTAQGHTGNTRAAQRCGAALERRTHDAALRNARGVECKRNDRGRNDRRRRKS